MPQHALLGSCVDALEFGVARHRDSRIWGLGLKEAGDSFKLPA